MSHWIFSQRDSWISLTYKNIVTGATFDCGRCRKETPTDVLLEWVLQRSPRSGDLVAFDTEETSTVMRIGGCA